MEKKEILRRMNDQYLLEKAESSGCSSGRCCCLSFLFLSLALAAAAVLVIILVLKPKKPIFHVTAIQLGDSFKLDQASGHGEDNSPPMISVIFITQNPNKLGIRYTSTKLGLMNDSNTMGIIEVPSFYQPPQNVNVSVIMHVIFIKMNVSKLVSIYMQSSEFQILGAVQVQAHLFIFPLPKIKISLDCRITMKSNPATVSRGLSFIKTHEALLPSGFPHISHKCSLDPCI